jgi:peptidoglycan-associated lipoprotein
MNYKHLLTLIFIGVSYIVNSQLIFVPKQVRKGNRDFRNENYCKGTQTCAAGFKKLQRKGPSALKVKGTMAYKTAECYRQIENYKDASEWFQKSIDLKFYEFNPEIYFYNGEMKRQMGEFDKAKENYLKYKELVPSDKRADIGLASCDLQQDLKINKTRHVITNISALNKEGFEMAPMFGDKKESMLYFSSNREGGVNAMSDPRSCEGYLDLWVSEIDKKGNWGQPKLVPIENKKNLGCDIWMSELKGKEWGEPSKLNLKNNDSISVGHPCISDDGKFLIFVSDAPGGFGGKDLYYSIFNKKENKWENPVNMGAEINTAGNDMFPTFAKNGDLFYATDGLPGMGGLDLFIATKTKDKNEWSKPTNLGFPLNSISNDYALVEVNKQVGYFTSERAGSVGKNYKPDLYKYELPPNMYSLKINTIDAFNKNLKIGGVSVLVKPENGEAFEGITREDGSISWDKKPNGERFLTENNTYSIIVEKPNFKSVKVGSISTVNVNYDQDFVVDMAMINNEPIRLPEVRYPLNQWTFVSDSTINSIDSINFVYDILVKYPNIQLELSSHTDARSGNVYNQILSENRAKALVKYLVEEKGVDPKRLVPVGKGEASPRFVYLKDGAYYPEVLNTEGYQKVQLTEAYINQFKKSNKKLYDQLHQYNRRAEGKVLEMNFDSNAAPAVSQDYFQFKELPKNPKL